MYNMYFHVENGKLMNHARKHYTLFIRQQAYYALILYQNTDPVIRCTL